MSQLEDKVSSLGDQRENGEVERMREREGGLTNDSLYFLIRSIREV